MVKVAFVACLLNHHFLVHSMQYLLIIVSIFFGLWLIAFVVAGLAYLRARLLHKPKEVQPKVIEEKVEEINTQVVKEETDPFEGFIRVTNQILEYKNTSNVVPLMVIGSMLGYEIESIVGPDSNFEDSFVKGSKKLLEFQRYKIITNGKITTQEYMYSVSEGIPTYYELVVKEYIDKYEFFLDNFKRYFDFVELNHQLLTAKKRTLLIQDEFGDVDGGVWIDYLQRFAERRELINPHQPIANEFEAVREYLKVIGLENFQGKALSYLLALYDHFNKKDDEFSNIYTGVDFELYLKQTLENTLPDVYVETTPASGDHGADLLVRYKGIVIAIQAKYYTGTVGNAAVQEIHSGMGFYDANYGMVVTQSKYTEHARSLANKLGIYLENTDTYIEKIKELAS